MFRVSKAVKKLQPMCRSMSTYKTSTGLVGLEVDPNGRQTLLDLAASIKEAVKVSFDTSKNACQKLSRILHVASKSRSIERFILLFCNCILPLNYHFASLYCSKLTDFSHFHNHSFYNTNTHTTKIHQSSVHTSSIYSLFLPQVNIELM